MFCSGLCSFTFAMFLRLEIFFFGRKKESKNDWGLQNRIDP
jgi:hypothetical protein